MRPVRAGLATGRRNGAPKRPLLTADARRSQPLPPLRSSRHASRMRSRTAFCAVVSTIGRRSAKLRRSPFTASHRGDAPDVHQAPPRRYAHEVAAAAAQRARFGWQGRGDLRGAPEGWMRGRMRRPSSANRRPLAAGARTAKPPPPVRFRAAPPTFPNVFELSRPVGRRDRPQYNQKYNHFRVKLGVSPSKSDHVEAGAAENFFQKWTEEFSTLMERLFQHDFWHVERRRKKLRVAKLSAA
jgi:hypothetical protein